MTDEQGTDTSIEVEVRPIPRMTEEEMNDLARRVVTNEVFITNSDEGIRLAFGFMLAFALQTSEDGTRMDLENIGAVWEELSKASPRGINGYPFFTSMRLVHKDDLSPLVDKIEEKEKALA